MVLTGRVVLIRRALKPHGGCSVVARHAATEQVHETQGALRGRVAPLGGVAMPKHGRAILGCDDPELVMVLRLRRGCACKRDRAATGQDGCAQGDGKEAGSLHERARGSRRGERATGTSLSSTLARTVNGIRCLMTVGNTALGLVVGLA